VIDGHQFIVEELMTGLSIERKLWDTPLKSLTLHTKLVWARDVAAGMAFIHERKFLHRDLKSPNILFSLRTGRAKIADFGIGRSFDDVRRKSSKKIDIVSLPTTEQKDDEDHTDWGVCSMTSDVGSLPWMAPEVMTSPDQSEYSSKYSPAIDCYSYGIVMWELMCHARPWSTLKGKNNNDDDDAKKIKRRLSVDIIRHVRDGKRPAIPSDLNGMPVKYVTLMQRCWNQDPQERPHFEYIVKVMSIMYSENETRDRKLRKTRSGSMFSFSSSSSSSSSSRRGFNSFSPSGNNDGAASVARSRRRRKAKPSSTKGGIRSKRMVSSSSSSKSVAIAIASPSSTKTRTSTASSSEIEMSSSSSLHQSSFSTTSRTIPSETQGLENDRLL